MPPATVIDLGAHKTAHEDTLAEAFGDRWWHNCPNPRRCHFCQAERRRLDQVRAESMWTRPLTPR